MDIHDLSSIPLETIVDCFLRSFKDYFVKMPSDIDFWKYKMKTGRVDPERSFGAFSEGQLVAFILHGIGERKGKMTAFNTGTGVIQEFRGNQLVDKMYAYAIPRLKRSGVEVCGLEVICENARAIKVYDRIGFKQSKVLKCFNGTPEIGTPPAETEEIDVVECMKLSKQFEPFHAWDNMNEAIELSKDHYQFFLIKNNNNESAGYFIINSKSGYLPQIESFNHEWDKIIAAVRGKHKTIYLNNIDSRKTLFIQSLIDAGVKNSIDQYEMEMII